LVGEVGLSGMDQPTTGVHHVSDCPNAKRTR
jgi:hypothetical protein